MMQAAIAPETPSQTVQDCCEKHEILSPQAVDNHVDECRSRKLACCFHWNFYSLMKF